VKAQRRLLLVTEYLSRQPGLREHPMMLLELKAMLNRQDCWKVLMAQNFLLTAVIVAYRLYRLDSN
jgi:hypothetical protein